MGDEPALEVLLAVGLGQIQEVHQVAVFEEALGARVQFSQRWREFWFPGQGPLEEGAADLPLQLAFAPAFLGGQLQVEGPLLVGSALVEDHQVVCPRQNSHQW